MTLALKPQGPIEYVEYIVPARRIAGTRAEVLAEIDELIQVLVGVHQLVSLHDQKQPSDAPKRRRRPGAD